MSVYSWLYPILGDWRHWKFHMGKVNQLQRGSAKKCIRPYIILNTNVYAYAQRNSGGVGQGPGTTEHEICYHNYFYGVSACQTFWVGFASVGLFSSILLYLLVSIWVLCPERSFNNRSTINCRMVATSLDEVSTFVV